MNSLPNVLTSEYILPCLDYFSLNSYLLSSRACRKLAAKALNAVQAKAYVIMQEKCQRLAARIREGFGWHSEPLNTHYVALASKVTHSCSAILTAETLPPLKLRCMYALTTLFYMAQAGRITYAERVKCLEEISEVVVKSYADQHAFIRANLNDINRWVTQIAFENLQHRGSGIYEYTYEFRPEPLFDASFTPLGFAIYKDALDTEALLKMGANPNLGEGLPKLQRQNSLLYTCFKPSWTPICETKQKMLLLLQNGARTDMESVCSVNFREKTQKIGTPLHEAVRTYNREMEVDIFRLFLECMPNPFIRDSEGDTPRELVSNKNRADYRTTLPRIHKLLQEYEHTYKISKIINPILDLYLPARLSARVGEYISRD